MLKILTEKFEKLNSTQRARVRTVFFKEGLAEALVLAESYIRENESKDTRQMTFGEEVQNGFERLERNPNHGIP